MLRHIIPVIIFFICMYIVSCKSKDAATAAVFCDTACFGDTLKFQGDHPKRPYVYLTASSCQADTITWSAEGMGVNKKVDIPDFLKIRVHLNKQYIRCFFKDGEDAWLLFNSCITGRGFSLRLPFNKDSTIGRKSRAINNLDKKFSVEDHLVAYSDGGNLYVEDMGTGKKAMMTFGQDLGIDYDEIHEYIDSVNITSSRIWARVKVGKEWKDQEKKITLE